MAGQPGLETRRSVAADRLAVRAVLDGILWKGAVEFIALESAGLQSVEGNCVRQHTSEPCGSRKAVVVTSDIEADKGREVTQGRRQRAGEAVGLQREGSDAIVGADDLSLSRETRAGISSEARAGDPGAAAGAIEDVLPHHTVAASDVQRCAVAAVVQRCVAMPPMLSALAMVLMLRMALALALIVVLVVLMVVVMGVPVAVTMVMVVAVVMVVEVVLIVVSEHPIALILAHGGQVLHGVRKDSGRHAILGVTAGQQQILVSTGPHVFDGPLELPRLTPRLERVGAIDDTVPADDGVGEAAGGVVMVAHVIVVVPIATVEVLWHCARTLVLFMYT